MSHSTDNDERELIRDMGSAAASAIGWDGSDKVSVARTSVRASSAARDREADRIRRRDEGLLDLLLEIQPASECTRHIPRSKPRRELFPNFWHQGEVAVLIGYPGVGRSILATQIAETIARGRQVDSEQRIVNNSESPSETAPSLFTIPCSLFTKPRPKAVVYFDFERTATQFTERYTAIAPNNRRIKYKFARRHQRSYPQRSLASLLRGFGYSRERMLVEALARKAASDRFTTMIVEDLTHLCGVGASANDVREMLRRFKRWSAGENSALIIAEPEPEDLPFLIHHSSFRPHHSRGRRPSKRLSAILSEADSVFTLNNSTFAPDFRYVKALKTGFQMDSGQLTMDNVPTGTQAPSPALELPLALANGSELQTKNSPPWLGGVANGRGGSIAELINAVHVYQLRRSASPPSLNFPLSTVNYPLNAAPFLGLQYIGLSGEAEHLRDYAAEIAKFEAAVLRAVEKEERRRKLSAKESLAQGIIDGSYARYMLNE